MPKKNDGEDGSKVSGVNHPVEIRGEQPSPMEVTAKIERDTVQWFSKDAKEYYVLFKRSAEWPFDGAPEPDTVSDEEHGLKVRAGEASRLIQVRKMGRHSYRVATERTRGMRKPPNGP